MGNDFLFHKVSEQEKELIKREAKKIIDDFSEKLSVIKEDISEPVIERKESERKEEKTKLDRDGSFRKIMFENAPNKEADFIISEKKKW
jgi:Asp-tRNA(Asn)/Glu-tRNA(Gln) amidotransferase C subunit